MNFENEDTFEEMNERLDKLIEDRIATERERCAKSVESYRDQFSPDDYGDAYSPYDICTEIAAKIRSGE